MDKEIFLVNSENRKPERDFAIVSNRNPRE